MRDARASLPYGLPARAAPGPRGDRRRALRLRAAPSPGRPSGRAASAASLAYLRVPGRVRFFLDRAVYHDTARALLPEIGGYAAGLVDHLFRAEIHLEVEAGAVGVSVDRRARRRARGRRARLRRGRRGQAPRVRRRRRPPTTPRALTIPAGTRRIAAVLRGADDAGELVAVAEQPVP